jgi:ribosomal protein S18 acetylase RimI-like enzyme
LSSFWGPPPIEAKREHFSEIANLVSSPEELFLVYPSGRYPWDIQQLNKLYEARKNFTVCIINGLIAAFANLYNIKPDDSAFIGNVIVSDAYKGQGVGKALTEYMLRLCKEKYNAVAHLSVFGFNARALLMYSKSGFVPYAVEQRKDLKGEMVALIHMRYNSKK